MRRLRWGTALLGAVAVVGLIVVLGGASVFSVDPFRYSIVIDAGSSGSRVYIYRWHVGLCLPSGIPNVTAVMKSDGHMAVKKVEPGLSSYKSEPHKAAESLGELLQFAESHVPPPSHSTTPIYVMATAGIRMLQPQTQAAILSEVRTFLEQTGSFHVPSDAVQVIRGERESLFTWIAANYGLGRFSTNGRSSSTYGCLDMGGASAQIAYEVESEDRAPDTSTGQWVVTSIWGRHVYAGTLQGFGANEARRRYIESVSTDLKEGEVGTDPCLPTGLVDDRRSRSGTLVSLVGTGDFDRCFAGVTPLLRSPAFGSFADTVLPEPRHYGPWYGVSEYWYTMEDVFGIGGVYDAVRFRQKARIFCGTEWSTLTKEYSQGMYPKAKPSRFKDECFKAAWMRAMLHDGYRFPVESPSFKSVSEVGGLPLQWTLGAVLYTMADRTHCEPATSGLSSAGGAVTVDATALYAIVGIAIGVLVSIWISLARRQRLGNRKHHVSHA